MNLMKNKLICIIVCATLIVLLGGMFVAFKIINFKTPVRRTEYILSVGDTLPNLPIDDSEERSTFIKDLVKNSSLLLIYIRSSCKDCQVNFAEYSTICNNPPEGYDVRIVWDDAIYPDILKKYNIPSKLSYTTNRAYKLSNWVPTYFIVNSDGIIEFRTTELSELFDFLKK